MMAVPRDRIRIGFSEAYLESIEADKAAGMIKDVLVWLVILNQLQSTYVATASKPDIVLAAVALNPC
jgi:hypothetical protein